MSGEGESKTVAPDGSSSSFKAHFLVSQSVFSDDGIYLDHRDNQNAQELGGDPFLEVILTFSSFLAFCS